MYSSTLSLTSVLDGVGGQRHAPADLPPVKTRYFLYRRLNGPQGRSGQLRKISAPIRIRYPDLPARSEALHRLSYPGPRPPLAVILNMVHAVHNLPSHSFTADY